MYEENLKLFAARLKEAREVRGLSQRELGAALGFSNSLIGKYEAGVNIPTITNALKLSRYLGVDDAWLLGSSEKSPTKQFTNDALIKAFEDYGIIKQGELISQELINAILPIAKTMADQIRKLQNK